MAHIQFNCPHCNKSIVVAESLAGKRGKCPGCAQKIEVPSPSASVPAVVSPPPMPAIAPVAAPVVQVVADPPPTKRAPQNDSVKQVVGVIGSCLMGAGVFAPFLSVPIVGGIDYFRNGAGDGVFVLVLALVAFVLTRLRLYLINSIPGVLALVCIAYSYATVQGNLAKAKVGLFEDDSLSGRMAASMAAPMLEGVTVSWGFFVLIAGAGMVIASSVIKAKPLHEH